jgi:hypothetical protein
LSEAIPMQRNGQNPIKSANTFSSLGGQLDNLPNHTKSSGGAGHCPSCKAEVTPKPGFRLSAMKCPKCGTSMAKK